MLIRYAGMVVGLFVGGLLFAQGPDREQAKPAAKMLPAQIMRGIRPAMRINTGRTPSLSQLVKAKIDADSDAPKLIVMLQAFRMEKKKGEFNVVKMRQEQRTRTINVDGKQVEQTYTVSVPYSATEVDPEVPVSAGIKPSTLDANAFEYYDLNGQSLSMEAAAKRMTKLMPVFLMEKYRGGAPTFSELQREALNPKCIVITSAERVRKQP